MRSVRQAAVPLPREQLFPTVHQKKFAQVARVLWPRKTSAELAFRAGVSERAAKYWLSGQREPSAAAFKAVFDEMMS